MVDAADARYLRANMIHFVQFCFLQIALVVSSVMLAAGPTDAYAQATEGVIGKRTAKAGILRNDLLVDRGGQGLWVFLNNTTWKRVDTGNPTAIAVGDINGDGKDDIIYGMNRTGRIGTFVQLNPTNPTVPIRLDPRPATRLAAGDFDNDGNSKVDLMATFQGTPGTFLWLNNHPNPITNSDFFKVHDSTANAIAVGDIQGDNVQDVIIALPTGLFVCYNAMAPWIPIGPDDAFPPGFQNVVVGDFNNDGRDDLLGDRGGSGIWRSMDGGNTWTRINTRNPNVLAVGDADGNLNDGAFAAFPNPNGGLFTSPTAVASPPWTRLATKIPTSIAVGRLDAGVKEDVLVVDPTNPNVIYLRSNNTGGFTPLTMPPGPAGPVEGILFGGFN
jgi:hypothetical protein